MKKTVNIIVYKPGYGGHFIQFLLSLDKSTVPCAKKNTNFEEIISRKEHYSFKDVRKTFKTWMGHHSQYDDAFIEHRKNVTELLTNEKYNSCVLQIHPLEFYYHTLTRYLSNLSVKINYLQIELSPEYEYVIDTFKKLNNGFPLLRPNEKRMNEVFKTVYSPYIINLDNFIIGEDHFIEEYVKINNYLQLPLHLNDALELYRDWYIERQIEFSLDKNNRL